MRPMRPSIAWPAALAAAAVATGIGFALDGAMSPAGLAMVYLLVLVACAAWLPRGPMVLAAVACTSALNWFFIPPRHTFEVDSPEYWWMLAVLLGVSVAASLLLTDLRQRQARAEAGEARTARLHAQMQWLAECGDDASAMATRAATWWHERFGKPCAVFLRDGEGWQIHAMPEGAAFQPGAARWALDEQRALGRGTDDWRDLATWCMPLAGQGAIQLLLAPRETPSREELQHWADLGTQLGMAIGRARSASVARDAQDSARAESARNTLLASLSHDLRTPLAALVGTASTLRQQGASLSGAQRDQLLANLEHEGRDLTAMADNVLQMARLAQPHQSLRLQWESVDDVLGAAVQRMRRRWEDAKVQLRVTPGLPPVRAEASLLAQVVANLVDNAVRHSGDAAHIVVTAGRSRGGVFIAVRDHGEGLPPGDPAHLFDSYRQGGRRAGGAGLGLAICQLVVEAHGGRIEAKRCDPGSEFRIDLPASEEGVPDEA